MTWFLYIVECSDGTYYTGISKNVQRRVHDHNNTSRGSRYTRTRRPVTLIASCPAGEDRSAAQKLERKIKKLPRRQKVARVQSMNVYQ